MNTQQNYMGRGSHANPVEETEQRPTSGVDNGQVTTSSDLAPFTPAFINVPMYLQVYGRDENNSGVSQLDVFLSSLFAYRETVARWSDSNDKELTLNLIDEMRDTALDVVYNHLSKAADILHRLNDNQSV